MCDKPKREQLFPTDEPVAPDRMIGRADDVTRIASSLAAGQSLRILAPRRTGKTTVCDAALDRLREQGWYVASVDLMHPTGATGLAQDLTRALLGSRPQLRRTLSEVRDTWERLGDRIRAQAVVDLGDGVSIAFGPGPARQDPDAALEEALSLPQRVAEKDGRPVALFLDELQELAAPAAPFGDADRLQARMRAIFQRSSQVSLLFAGSLEHSMRRVFQPDAPLGGFGGSYVLSEIATQEWEDGLAARFDDASVGADEAILVRIVELGDGHPRATMLIAAEAYTAVREAGANALDATVVALAWQRARSHDVERCRLMVERMRRLRLAKGKDLALRLVRSVAAGEPPYSVAAHAEQVKRVLDALSDIGAVEQLGRGSWRVPDPILRAYLADGS
jgi:DNA-binding transcriptional ArsR family regulator